MEQTATSDLYLDRNREVWRRVHDGSLMRLSLGGYINPAHPFDMVELRWGPLRELVPIERGTRREPTVPASQLRAFARLCVDGGDMTPAAARMLDRIIDGDRLREKP